MRTALLLGLLLVAPRAAAAQPSDSVVVLFDGSGLEGPHGAWRDSGFGFKGLITVVDGLLQVEMADGLAGVTWTGEVPREQYELELEARRVLGGDFFVGLTFPVGAEHASLIVGGWGGVVVGLSSIDGADASGNETTRYRRFEDDRWYHVRLRVTADSVLAWIDDEPFVAVARAGRRFSIRPEMTLATPLGLATWRTTGHFRGIRLRRLPSSFEE